MANEISNELIFETLKSMQVQIKQNNLDVVNMQRSMLDNFSSLRAHIMAHHSDQFSLEQRIAVELATSAILAKDFAPRLIP